MNTNAADGFRQHVLKKKKEFPEEKPYVFLFKKVHQCVIFLRVDRS